MKKNITENLKNFFMDQRKERGMHPYLKFESLEIPELIIQLMKLKNDGWCKVQLSIGFLFVLDKKGNNRHMIKNRYVNEVHNFLKKNYYDVPDVIIEKDIQSLIDDYFKDKHVVFILRDKQSSYNLTNSNTEICMCNSFKHEIINPVIEKYIDNLVKETSKVDFTDDEKKYIESDMELTYNMKKFYDEHDYMADFVEWSERVKVKSNPKGLLSIMYINDTGIGIHTNSNVSRYFSNQGFVEYEEDTFSIPYNHEYLTNNLYNCENIHIPIIFRQLATVFLEEYYNLAKLYRDEDDLKYDSEKAMLNIVPTSTINSIGKVMTYGAKKYSINSWKKVDVQRYMAAMLRHYCCIQEVLEKYDYDVSRLTDTDIEQLIDGESFLWHSEHMLCNASFINDLMLHKINFNKDTN